jgi:GR25 family glycosyltransferase involved in LPS biosynthesis
MFKRFFQSSAVFGFVFCSLLSSPVFARTLFIDFNNAESEIAVFKQRQQGVASEVVVVPSYQRITPKQRLHILKTNEAIERYTSKVQDCAVAVKKDKRCDSYYDQIYMLEQEREKTTGYYNAEDLKKELLALLEDKNAVPFDMVVISGHHEQGFYRGELTDARVKEFVDMMDESRALFSKVNTVVFLGCETGTKAVYQNTLLTMFPTVPVILASEDNAPTRNEARNLAYIRHVVSIRPKLLAAKTATEVQPLYNSLLAKHWPASLLWRQNVVFFKDSTELL